jgi:uncharacterized protein (DUF1330 family)
MLEAADARAISFDPDALVIEGSWKRSTLIMLEFPTTAAADTFFASVDYAPLRELRRSIANTSMVVAETASTE